MQDARGDAERRGLHGAPWVERQRNPRITGYETHAPTMCTQVMSHGTSRDGVGEVRAAE